MSTSSSFKTAIETHLESVAANDPLFAETLKKPAKNINDCCNYITSEVRKKHSGSAIAVTNDEVFKMAVHYYDEDDIKPGKPVNAQVSTVATPIAPAKPVSKKKPFKEAAEKQAYLF
jgi:hypothetical protein